jgi:uncharacterized repeat protein (TIGR03803 family)
LRANYRSNIKPHGSITWRDFAVRAWIDGAVADGNFYGTTALGGASSEGTVFKITPAGVETVIYYFTGGAAVNHPGALIQGADGIFYGTTAYGGSSNLGTVFAF